MGNQSGLKRRYKITFAQMPQTALEIAHAVRGGEIFALIGPMGSGKTSFVKIVAKAFGIRQRVTSPTFTLLNSYTLPKTKKIGAQLRFLHHLDLYRTKNVNEILQLGVTDIWGQPDSVTFIEWADMMDKHLPKQTIYIYFTHEKDLLY